MAGINDEKKRKECRSPPAGQCAEMIGKETGLRASQASLVLQSPGWEEGIKQGEGGVAAKAGVNMPTRRKAI